MRKFFFILLIALILGSCASVYKPIQPKRLRFLNVEESEKINYAYKFDVLREKGNRKYANKENKYGIDIVALKITNNSDEEIDFNKDIKIFIGNREVIPLESDQVTSKIKQGVIGYIFYGLLAVYIVNGDDVTTIPIGIPIGIGNMIVAGSGNSSFKKEFNTYNLLGRTIQPNETFEGLIAFQGIEYGNLELIVKDEYLSGQ